VLFDYLHQLIARAELASSGPEEIVKHVPPWAAHTLFGGFSSSLLGVLTTVWQIFSR
jgi:hypothetical protein